MVADYVPALLIVGPTFMVNLDFVHITVRVFMARSGIVYCFRATSVCLSICLSVCSYSIYCT